MSRHIYRLFDQHANGEQIAIAEVAFEQKQDKGIIRAQFCYLDAYLKQFRFQARPIDPVNLPLTNEVLEFTELPGALNDILPDRWGREVALKIHQITRNNVAGLIDWLSTDHIGSFSLVKLDEHANKRTIGADKTILVQLDIESKKFEDQAIPEIAKEWALTLASGSSVGGARRKTLVSHQHLGYLVKFQQKNDSINMPMVEHATMTLAKKAGLLVANTSVEKVNGKDALFVRRFDIINGLPCRQLLSFDSLLNGHTNQYGDLAQILIKNVSMAQLEASLYQLSR